MKTPKLTAIAVAFAAAGLLSSANVLADNTASAFTKNGTAVIGAAAVNAGLADAQGFTKVLETTLQNSGTPKDLIVGLSFETSLFTKTVVTSKSLTKSTAVANAEIEMYVTIDGQEALPGTVTFDKRYQELWAKLGGFLDCNDANGDGVIQYSECTLTEEEIGLILDTKAAHSFNFLAYNIGSGSHKIEAFARLSKDGTAVTEGTGDAAANASLGKGTLSVWEVHGSNVTQ
ncbi:MAG: hypothetical protein ACU83V_05435 [Gammaproteobacteria bacterium]